MVAAARRRPPPSRQCLVCVIKQALTYNCAVLVRVFSIGRPRELLYESISHFAQGYSELEPFWGYRSLK